jgi:hypothetical protein
MKNIFRSVWICLKGIGYARAAADLARNGKHKEAQALMTQYGECK